MESLRPVQRRSVPDEVAEQLVDGIVAGELPAGEALPSERELAERLGVSRPTVRAALARLASAGLVETRQGGGTTVRDYRRHAGLDLLPRLLIGGGGLDVTVVRDVVRTRALLGAQVAALAAAATPGRADDGRLIAARAALAEALDDDVARELAAVAYWDELVDRSGSIVFRLLYNQLRAVYEPVLDALAGLLGAESRRADLYDQLTEAVMGADAAGARAVATQLLAIGADVLSGALDQLATAT